MNRKNFSIARGFVVFPQVLVGLLLLVVLALFFYNNLFASRTQPPLQTTSQPQTSFSQELSPTTCTNNKVYKTVTLASREPDNVCILDLSNSELTQLPPQVMELNNLTALYLNFNKLTSLPPEIAKLKNLTLIDLTGNPISDEEVNKIRLLLPKANIGLVKPMN